MNGIKMTMQLIPNPKILMESLLKSAKFREIYDAPSPRKPGEQRGKSFTF
jgi:hypothetical protein